jgi:hypothetical protein
VSSVTSSSRCPNNIAAVVVVVVVVVVGYVRQWRFPRVAVVLPVVVFAVVPEH